MKKLFLITMIILFYVTVSYSFTVDHITYTSYGDSYAMVTGYEKSLVNVVIPSEVTYQGVTYKVKSIAKKGLFCSTSSSSKMQTLVVSEGVETISEQGIQGNNNLRSVQLPSTLEMIGSKAFYDLRSLNSVIFPNGSTLKFISDYAFQDCRKLETLSFFPSEVELSSGECTFPESLETIGKYAFRGVPAIKNLVLQGEIKCVEKYAFSECPVEYIWLKEGITEIEEYAFYGCPTIEHVVLPSTLSKVGNGAFGRTNNNNVNRTFVFLADEPFPYSPKVQTDFYGLWLPANITAIDGDRFYVKESSIEKYRTVWKGVNTDVFDYKIPFNSELTYSSNYREYDTDFHVTAENGNQAFVATRINNTTIVFYSIDSNIVPARTAVLIRKQSDVDTWYQIAEEQGAKLEMTNYLKGVVYADELFPTTDDGLVNYVLYNGEFCRFNNAGVLGAHKAYLQIPETISANNCSILFGDSQMDKVSDMIKEINVHEQYYNLFGLPMEKVGKGLFITKGKKIFVK